MFFSTYVLTKKGPLAKIWLAAHWDRRLTSKDVRLIDLNDTVLHIVKPSVPIALRTSGELMLGVVRIYAVKVMTLLKDVNEVTTLLLRPRQIQLLKGGAVFATGAAAAASVAGGKDLGKDTTLAVTMDVIVGRVGNQQVGDADFGTIADILAPSKNKDAASKKGPADADAAAWFSTAGSSQFQDEIRLSMDDLNVLRADLQAMEALDPASAAQRLRGESGTTGSKSKSSASSVEKARGQSDAEVAGLLGDQNMGGFDVPLPEDLANMQLTAGELLDQQPFGNFDDPFALGAAPDMPTSAAPADLPGGLSAVRGLRKIKSIPLDSKDHTVLKNETVMKNANDRRDIVTAERRHGAVNDRDAADRAVIRNADAAVGACEPLSLLYDDTDTELRAAFTNALRQSVQKALEAIEASRGGAAATAAGDAAPPVPFAADDNGAGFIPDPTLEFEYRPDAADEFSSVNAPNAEEGRPSRKRGRGATENEAGALSASTIATMESIRTLLSRAVAMPFSKLVAGKRRQELARMFVDCLALASQQFIDVAQSVPFGDIVVRKTEKLTSSAAAAAAAAVAKQR